MTSRVYLTLILLFFVTGSVVFVFWPEVLTANRSTADNPGQSNVLDEESDVTSKQSDTPDTHKYIAYYFHGDARCPTCLNIEAYSKEAIEAAFPEKLELGDLEWRSVNTDEDSNSHYKTDFKLEFSSLVFAEFTDGKVLRFENQEKVWELAHDKETFVKYVESQAKKFMGETQ